MSYKEILESVKGSLQPGCRWWTKYLFHFTDIMNAVGIIKENMIYPRSYVTSKGLSKNDNANIQVIIIPMTTRKILHVCISDLLRLYSIIVRGTDLLRQEMLLLQATLYLCFFF